MTLFLFAVLLSGAFQVQAANFDLTGSCPGGVGNVSALIGALNNANGNGEADTITLAAGCVYTLDALDNATDGDNGLPSITSPIVIQGNGAVIRRAPAAANFRIFHVAGAGALTLDDLVVENGVADEGGWMCPEHCGGGIYAAGALTLTQTTLRYNRAVWDGGGLYSIDNTLFVAASTIFSNTAGEGGGVHLVIEGGDLTAIVENSQIVSNTAELGGGGLFVYGAGNSTLTLTMNRSAVSFNETTINGFGGGIGMWAGAGIITLNINDSAVDWNVASRGGGGMNFSSYGAQVTVNINRSTVNWNQALDDWDSGGGIATTADGPSNVVLNLIDSTVNGNQTEGHGGGIANEISQMTLTGSTISANRAGIDGGGISNMGEMYLSNCTVSGNQAAGEGGGLFNMDTLHMTHVTVAGNIADSDGDDVGDGGGLSQGGTATLTNTILSNNVDGSPTGDVFTDCYQTTWGGEVTDSGGYNLVQNVLGCAGIFTATGDITNSDPLLGPLQDNGGPPTSSGQATWTHALLTGSPARDIIPNGTNGCGTAIIVDQRGLARPFPAGGACDSGAYEALATYVITPTAGTGGSISPDTPQTVEHGGSQAFTVATNVSYHIVDVGVDGVSIGVTTAYTFTNVQADHTITATFALYTYTVVVSANPVTGGAATGGGTFEHGVPVVVTATANTGYTFVNWTEDGAPVSTDAVYSFTIAGDRTLVANFALNSYTLDVAIVGQGSVTRVPSQTTYLHGEVVTLTAIPDSGWYFGQWSGAASGIFTQTTVTMNASQTVTATFLATPSTYYTLTMQLVGNGVITPSAGAHLYLAGAQIDLSATAAAGWTFTGWTGDATSSENPFSLVMDEDKTVTATFARTVPTRYVIYLPIVLRQQLPDLIIRSVTVSPSALLVDQPVTITVVIENIGGLSVLEPFWVDLYIDPDPALMPPQVNQTWDMVGSRYGLAWWVTQNLAPGEQITLTSLSYAVDYSDWPGYFDCFGPHILYAQVDSYSSSAAAYGAISETDETNNIYGPVTVSVMCPPGMQLLCPAPQMRNADAIRPRP